ncbi:hypothetical protein IV203_037080 [Nitzschia inconspicua]|uniref:Uncharacterized protein n=1 Tax=Nitzschia inconspicua TaxID=303405 RepID=A0A9K3LL95_9STRA|nr:hypothetical protein IV203_037080 [Nitzschia inconspicua]
MSDHCINPWVAPMLLCLFENAITVDNVTIIGRDPDERIPFFEAIQKGVHKVAKLNLTLCSLSPALVRILSAGLTIGPEIPTTIVFPSNKGISDSTTVDALAEEIYKWNRVKKLDFMFSQLSNDDIQTMVTGLCRAGNDSQLTCLLLPAETHLNTCVLNSLGTLIRTSPSLEGLCCKMIIVDNDSSSNVDCTEFSQALAHPSTRLEWINMGGEISSANYVLLADAMATNRWMKNLSADLPRGSSDFALMETLQALRCALEQNKKSSLITVSAESRSFEGSIIYRALLGREFLREGPRE